MLVAEMHRGKSIAMRLHECEAKSVQQNFC